MLFQQQLIVIASERNYILKASNKKMQEKDTQIISPEKRLHKVGYKKKQ